MGARAGGLAARLARARCVRASCWKLPLGYSGDSAAKTARLEYEERAKRIAEHGEAPEAFQVRRRPNEAVEAFNIIEKRIEILENNERITLLEIGVNGESVKIIEKRSTKKQITTREGDK